MHLVISEKREIQQESLTVIYAEPSNSRTRVVGALLHHEEAMLILFSLNNFLCT